LSQPCEIHRLSLKCHARRNLPRDVLPAPRQPLLLRQRTPAGDGFEVAHGRDASRAKKKVETEFSRHAHMGGYIGSSCITALACFVS